MEKERPACYLTMFDQKSDSERVSQFNKLLRLSSNVNMTRSESLTKLMVCVREVRSKTC